MYIKMYCDPIYELGCLVVKSRLCYITIYRMYIKMYCDPIYELGCLVVKSNYPLDKKVPAH